MNKISTSDNIFNKEVGLAKTLLESNDSDVFYESEFFKKTYNRVKGLEKYLLGKTVFVCIGCGPIPATLMYAKDNSNVIKFVGVDISDEALSLSSKVTGLLGYNFQFVKEINLSSIESERVIFIANHVKPKAEVVSSFVKQIEAGDLIIVRDNFISEKSLFEIEEQLATRVEIIARDSVCAHFKTGNLIIRKRQAL